MDGEKCDWGCLLACHVLRHRRACVMLVALPTLHAALWLRQEVVGYMLHQAAPQHLHACSRHVPAMYLHAAGICTGKETNTVHQRSTLTMFAYAECSQVSRGCFHGVRHGRPELPGVGRAAADAVTTEHRAVAGPGCISWACIGRLSGTRRKAHKVAAEGVLTKVTDQPQGSHEYAHSSSFGCAVPWGEFS